jgi:hypothetical protein
VIRGGIGEFRGRAPTGLFAAAIDATGLPGDQQQLVCIGAAVPVPSWNALPRPTRTPCPPPAPTARVGTAQNANQRPNVSLIDPDFGRHAPGAARSASRAASATA